MIFKCHEIEELKKAFNYAKRQLEIAKHGILVNVSLKKFKRSTDQNRYYWGVVLRMISDDTGYEQSEVHEILKTEFLKVTEKEINGKLYPIFKSSTKLNTAEFEEYLEKCRRFAAMNLQLVILLPNESEEMWK